MASTEWWQRGPIENVPAVLQTVAHILLQVRESVGEMVDGLTEAEWNRRPGGVASAAFHLRHIAGVIDRLFTYARGEALSATEKRTVLCNQVARPSVVTLMRSMRGSAATYCSLSRRSQAR